MLRKTDRPEGKSIDPLIKSKKTLRSFRTEEFNLLFKDELIFNQTAQAAHEEFFVSTSDLVNTAYEVFEQAFEANNL
jgi:hypothetical protein